MAKLYRVRDYNLDKPNVCNESFTWDLDAAKEHIFKRYEGQDCKMIKSTDDFFYWGIYDKAPLEVSDPPPKLLSTIHEVYVSGKRLKFKETYV